MLEMMMLKAGDVDDYSDDFDDHDSTDGNKGVYSQPGNDQLFGTCSQHI